MNPRKQGFEERLAGAISLPVSAQQFLYLYWLLANERLKRLAEESALFRPVNQKTENVPEWIRKVQAHVEKTEDLMLLLRRVESYLGHEPRKIDPQIKKYIDSREAAKFVRALIHNGFSDEDIATWMRHFFLSSAKRTRGRPAGTVDDDGHALLALVLYDWNPKIWCYPKLADSLLECKCRGPHAADSHCVDKLKKALKRLRGFLKELGYKHAGK